MATKKTQTTPRAALAAKQPTELILSFCEYLEAETGYKVDPVSVYLGSALRGDFQKSPANQKRIAEQLARVAADKLAREKRATERAAKETKPQPAQKSKVAKKAEPVKARVRRRPLKVEANA